MEDPGYPFDPRTGPYRNGLLSGGPTLGGLLGAVMSQPGIMQQMANPPTLAQIRDGSADISAPMGLMMGMVSPSPGGGIRAFHGSPFRFDRFDSARINSGEGAQAYGHGLYFVDDLPVARAYRDDLSAGYGILGLSPRGAVEREIQSWLQNARNDAGFMPARYDITDWLRGRSLGDHSASDVSAALTNMLGRVNHGHVYEVNLGVDPARMMALDEGRQTAQVVQSLRSMGLPDNLPSGRHYTRELARRGMAPEQTADALLNAGIPGMRYRPGPNEPNHYVMFPGQDNLIQIIRRYGILGPAAGYGLLGGQQ